MNFLKVDSNFRYIISIFYRIVIFIYAIIILCSNENCFEWYWYVFGFFLYWFIFIQCFRKQTILSKVRFFNDYLLLFFILYGKDLSKLDNAIFLILPIFNSYNHTGSRNFIITILLYLIPGLGIWYFSKLSFLEVLIPFLSLIIINTFFYVRNMVIQSNERLNQSFEKYYIDGKDIGRAHRILKNFIKIHSEESYSKIFVNISHIVCFKLVDEKIYLINSSNFIIKWKIEESDFVSRLMEKKQFKNIAVKIDDWDTTYNRVYKITLNTHIYCFLIVFDKNPFQIFYELYAQKILLPVLKRMGQVIITESDIKNEKRKLLNQIKSKLEYVDLSANAIHFLNNKLNPLSLYFQLVDQLPKLEPGSEQYMETEKIMNESFNDAKANFAPAMERISMVMNSGNGPLAESEYEEVKLQRLFVIIRGMLLENKLGNPEELIFFNWQKEDLDFVIKLNIPFMEFVFEEIFINIKKHNGGFMQVVFNRNENQIYVEFVNNISGFGDVDLTLLDRYIRDFNNENMSEILRRGIKGLRLLKQFLQQLQLTHIMYRNNDLLKTKIFFKNENSGI